MTIETTTGAEFQRIRDIPSKRSVFVLFFWAEWAEPSKDMKQIYSDLKQRYDETMDFFMVEAETSLGLCEELSVESVPSFIFVESSSGKVLDRVEGANPALFSTLVSKYSEYKGDLKSSCSGIINAASASSASDVIDINARLESLINTCPVMLFMKGSPETPKCGFSRQIVQILNDRKVSFGYFDILNDQVVREELKRYSDWATYPQLYIKGELVGGLDIVKEAIESGDFDEMLPSSSEHATLTDRLEKLINKDELMIFIKGTPETPKCGFTRQLLELLQGHKFSYFDILSDEEVRQGLKEYSDWPTYPQVYRKGELLGGLDIVKDMIESGEF